MEDTKKKLELKNPHIQIKALWKLYSDILKKSKADGAIRHTKSEGPNLKFLWQKCTSENHVICSTSCQVLVELLYQKALEFKYIYQGFINLIPSARSLYGIVPALGEMLILQALNREASSSRYVCPFQMRNPAHPFIIVLTYHCQSWNIIQQQVHSLYHHPNSRVRCLASEILKPFVQFVFLQPQQELSQQYMRNSLQEVLLNACQEEEFGQSVIQMLVDIIPGLQIKSSEDLGRTVQFLTQLLHVINNRQNYATADNVIGPLLSFSISIIQPSLKRNLSTTTTLQEILCCLKQIKRIHNKEICIVLLADVLSFNGLDTALDVLFICKVLLDKEDNDVCQMAGATLILPLLQLMSVPSEHRHSLEIRNVTSQLLSLIDSLPAQTSLIPDQIESTSLFVADASSCHIYTGLIHEFVADKTGEKAREWISNVKDSLEIMKTLPHSVTNLVSSLLVTSSSQSLTESCLSLLVEIAKKDNSQSPNFLPLLLYELGREDQPETRLIIMEYMPSMARHKVCIGPTLKTIEMIGSVPKLRPIAIRLLTQLWQLQDRCFPHLIKMLTEKSNNSSYDVIIAQASAIKDICFLRPEQHGEDLLSPVSDILNKSSDVNMAPAAALVLEALYMMCEAEVIDIKSAWSLLAAKLSSENRPAVVEKICDLFAIVPSLSTNTDEYDQFMADILDKLWIYCGHSNSTIVGSAYQALASYSLDKFRLYHLPAKATKEIRLELERKADQQEDGEVNLSVPVPSVCYLNILKTLRPEILEDFGVFMSGILSKEVEDLPRGIYHSSTRRQTVVSGQGKAISSIPAFILSEYEKTNQPGLRPSLAVGLLFCYDPAIEVGRDGRPRRHYVISHGKNYQQMFTTLLQEVTIQPSEWHRCMLLPQAWTSFVDRLYTAVIEGKKVEIDLQLRQGSIKEDEVVEKKSTIWLWARDMLTDEIKKASKQSPSMQGNSIYALSGLAIAVSRHVSSFDTEDVEKAKEIQRYRSHSDWMIVVLDTITSLMDVDYESKGDKLNLCQQGDLNEKKPASLLARTSACVALTQLVPVMMTCDTDRIYHLITMFKNSLPGQSQHEHHSPVSQFYYGLATGMLLGRLFEEHFSDICGAKGMTEIWKALTVLEECCFDKELENRSGAILGLGLSISGLSQEGKTDSRVHVITVQEQMMKLCEELSVEDKSYQAICMSLSCISGSAFDSNILPVEKINKVVDLLHTKHNDHPLVSSLSIALGMLCYSLHKIGHPSIDKLRQTLVNSWTKSLTSEDSSPMEKVSVLNGLLAIIGSERTLIPVKTTSGLKGDAVSSNDVIKLASSMVVSSKDLGLQSSAAWMLGHLYLSACAVAETRASVPPNYNYLKETSVVRAVVDLLLEAGKLGPGVVTDKQLEIALTALQEEVSRVLPPLNWAGVLSPLMRLEYGTKVKCLCLKLAVKQCMAAPTATTFLSSWMISPLFESLTDDCKLILFESLPYLMKVVANSVLQMFLEKSCMLPFLNKSDHCLSILEGLNKALLVQDPPKAATSLLYEATERFYKNLPENAAASLLCAMSKCYLSIPDQLFDQWIQDDFTSQKTFVNGVYIRCQLIAVGRQPLALLNSCLDATINNKDCDRSKVFSIVSHCFYSTMLSKSELTGPTQQLQWLLELLGHIRNLALGIIKLDTMALPLDQVLEFIIGIASSALCLWTMPGTSNMIGIKPNLLLSDSEDPTINSNVVIPNISSLKSLYCLPVAIKNLKSEPWSQLQPKVIDWMICLSQLPNTVISQNVLQSLKASLYKLRDSEEFEKASIWTKVFVL